MDITLVLKQFCLFSGLREEEAKIWLPLCQFSVASIYSKLDTRVDVTAYQTALCLAAASMAYYKYVLRNASKEATTSFTAGDIKITEQQTDAVQAAKQQYDQSIEAIRHLFAVDDFHFMGVIFS